MLVGYNIYTWALIFASGDLKANKSKISIVLWLQYSRNFPKNKSIQMIIL